MHRFPRVVSNHFVSFCGNRFDQCLTRLGGLPNYDYIWWNATDWEGGLKYAPALQETAQKVRLFFYERPPAQTEGLKLGAQDSVMWRYTGRARYMVCRHRASTRRTGERLVDLIIVWAVLRDLKQKLGPV